MHAACRDSVGRLSQRHHGTPSRSLRIEALEDRRMLAARAVEAINTFAADVYEHLQYEDGNLFFSPLSISTALSMTYAGANGQTATEMEQVLHLGSEPGIHESFGQLLSSIEQLDWLGDYELSTANAIWPRDSLPVGQGFVDTIETDYGGLVQPLDYSYLDAAEATINDWVAQQTRNKIQDLVSGLTPAIQMVLTNAVYFRGQWDYQFDPRFTSSGTFNLDDGGTVNTPMMLTQPTTVFTQIDGFQILDLPMGDGRASMVLMLPPTSGPDEITAELLGDIDAWLASSPSPDFLDVYLPKFQTNVSTGLNTLLKELGMPTAFTAAADFSDIASGIFISKVFHKADIEVNEQGTEAAAATEVDFVLCFAEGTPVLTPDGEKPIEELAAGDYVLARDERNVEGELQPKLVEKRLHGHADIVELHVGGRVIRTTDAHPFFVQGRGWTPAIELRPHDKLSTDHRDWVEVEQVVRTEEAEPVYNLRVSDHRTYFVGSEKWGFAVWAHNSYGDEFIADRPFHFMIRDNATSAITFMGRIDDPTQTVNEVNPTVQRGSDFDGDGDTDGNDFLTWQREYGTTFDANDLATWQASMSAPAAASAGHDAANGHAADDGAGDLDRDTDRDESGDDSDLFALRSAYGVAIEAGLPENDSNPDVDKDDHDAWQSAYDQYGTPIESAAAIEGVAADAESETDARDEAAPPRRPLPQPALPQPRSPR